MPGDTSFCHLPLPPVTLQLFIVLGNDRANRLGGHPQVRGCTQIPPLASGRVYLGSTARSLPEAPPSVSRS